MLYRKTKQLRLSNRKLKARYRIQWASLIVYKVVSICSSERLEKAEGPILDFIDDRNVKEV